MASFTALYHNTFRDKKFRTLSVEGKLFFLYLLANSNINLVGIYELNPEIVEVEMKGWKNGFEVNMKELIDKKMVEWDKEDEMVWIINRFNRLASRNGKVVLGALNDLEKINHLFKERFIEKYRPILKPYLYKVEQQSPSSFLEEAQLQYLVKIYNSKETLKRFLIDKNVAEAQVDKALSKYLPNLK